MVRVMVLMVMMKIMMVLIEVMMDLVVVVGGGSGGYRLKMMDFGRDVGGFWWRCRGGCKLEMVDFGGDMGGEDVGGVNRVVVMFVREGSGDGEVVMVVVLKKMKVVRSPELSPEGDG